MSTRIMRQSLEMIKVDPGDGALRGAYGSGSGSAQCPDLSEAVAGRPGLFIGFATDFILVAAGV